MRSERTCRSPESRSGLSQAELARRAGTSQATISAYERGRKVPSIATLSRVLAACGPGIEVGRTPTVRRPTADELARAAEALEQVVELAALLPTRHDRELRYPRLPVPTAAR